MNRPVIEIRSRHVLEPLIGVRVINLLQQLACLLIGHAPIVARRGDDSVLVCERCHRFIKLFVNSIYLGNIERTHRVGNVEDPL